MQKNLRIFIASGNMYEGHQKCPVIFGFDRHANHRSRC